MHKTLRTLLISFSLLVIVDPSASQPRIFVVTDDWLVRSYDCHTFNRVDEFKIQLPSLPPGTQVQLPEQFLFVPPNLLIIGLGDSEARSAFRSPYLKLLKIDLLTHQTVSLLLTQPDDMELAYDAGDLVHDKDSSQTFVHYELSERAFVIGLDGVIRRQYSHVGFSPLGSQGVIFDRKLYHLSNRKLWETDLATLKERSVIRFPGTGQIRNFPSTPDAIKYFLRFSIPDLKYIDQDLHHASFLLADSGVIRYWVTKHDSTRWTVDSTKQYLFQLRDSSVSKIAGKFQFLGSILAVRPESDDSHYLMFETASDTMHLLFDISLSNLDEAPFLVPGTAIVAFIHSTSEDPQQKLIFMNAQTRTVLKRYPITGGVVGIFYSPRGPNEE